jgi:hypothetical protein
MALYALRRTPMLIPARRHMRSANVKVVTRRSGRRDQKCIYLSVKLIVEHNLLGYLRAFIDLDPGKLELIFTNEPSWNGVGSFHIITTKRTIHRVIVVPVKGTEALPDGQYVDPKFSTAGMSTPNGPRITIRWPLP